MGSDRRTYRVAEAIRQQLAQRLVETADDRFRMVTITAVKVSKDLRLAKVYWMSPKCNLSNSQSAANSKSAIREISDAFAGASGYFRSSLANGLKLRFVPELRFYYDDTLDTAEMVNRLIGRVNISNNSDIEIEVKENLESEDE